MFTRVVLVAIVVICYTHGLPTQKDRRVLDYHDVTKRAAAMTHAQKMAKINRLRALRREVEENSRIESLQGAATISGLRRRYAYYDTSPLVALDIVEFGKKLEVTTKRKPTSPDDADAGRNKTSRRDHVMSIRRDGNNATEAASSENSTEVNSTSEKPAKESRVVGASGAGQHVQRSALALANNRRVSLQDITSTTNQPSVETSTTNETVLQENRASLPQRGSHRRGSNTNTTITNIITSTVATPSNISVQNSVVNLTINLPNTPAISDQLAKASDESVSLLPRSSALKQVPVNATGVVVNKTESTFSDKLSRVGSSVQHPRMHATRRISLHTNKTDVYNSDAHFKESRTYPRPAVSKPVTNIPEKSAQYPRSSTGYSLHQRTRTQIHAAKKNRTLSAEPRTSDNVIESRRVAKSSKILSTAVVTSISVLGDWASDPLAARRLTLPAETSNEKRELKREDGGGAVTSAPLLDEVQLNLRDGIVTQDHVVKEATIAAISIVTVAPVTVAPVPVAPVTVAPVPVAPAPVAPVPVAPLPAAPLPISPLPVAPLPVAPLPVAPVTVAPISTIAPVTNPPVPSVSVTPKIIPPVSFPPIAVTPRINPPVSLAPVSSPPVSVTPRIIPLVSLPPLLVPSRIILPLAPVSQPPRIILPVTTSPVPSPPTTSIAPTLSVSTSVSREQNGSVLIEVSDEAMLHPVVSNRKVEEPVPFIPGTLPPPLYDERILHPVNVVPAAPVTLAEAEVTTHTAGARHLAEDVAYPAQVASVESRDVALPVQDTLDESNEGALKPVEESITSTVAQVSSEDVSMHSGDVREVPNLTEDAPSSTERVRASISPDAGLRKTPEEVTREADNSDDFDVDDEVKEEVEESDATSYVVAAFGVIPVVVAVLLAANHFISKRKKVTEGEKSPLTFVSTNEWEFPRSKLRLQTVLGQGNFGLVYKAEADDILGERATRLVAVKTVKEGASSREKEDLMRELAIMKQIGSHSNVVALFGCCTEKEPSLLILEYVMYGKLLSFLRDHRTRKQYYHFSEESAELTAKDLTSFAYCVARGMEYLSSKGIIHRDLAARNILVDHNKMCKVADFGMSRSVSEPEQIYEQTRAKGALPIRWMAPESLTHRVFTSKSDVWAFGILMWEIVTLGSIPYPSMNGRQVMREVRDGYRLERPTHCRPELYRVAATCWHAEARRRPTFAEVRAELCRLLDNGEYVDLDGYMQSISSPSSVSAHS